MTSGEVGTVDPSAPFELVRSRRVILPPKFTPASFEGDIGRWLETLRILAPQRFDPTRLVLGTLAALHKNDALMLCQPWTVFCSMARAAQLGLDIGHSGMWLVPSQNSILAPTGKYQKVWQCEAWPDYRALKLLLIRAGLLRRATEFVIWNTDEYAVEYGSHPTLRHRPLRGDGSPRSIVAAYSRLEFRGAVPGFHLLEIDAIEAIRSKSRGWKPNPNHQRPERRFLTCPPWYSIKTTFKDYASRQPQTAETGLGLATLSDDTTGPGLGAGVPLELLRDPETGESSVPTPIAAEAGRQAAGGPPADDVVTADQLALLRSLAARARAQGRPLKWERRIDGVRGFHQAGKLIDLAAEVAGVNVGEDGAAAEALLAGAPPAREESRSLPPEGMHG